MGSKLKPEIAKILKSFGLDPRESLWDCHGSWVLLHKACQTIQHRLGIVFSEPKVLHMDLDKKQVVFQVMGHGKDGVTRYDIGEAMPSNNKNAYPCAMALKRAEDKVIIHLAKLREHGVYSSEEAEEFKSPKVDKEDTAERVKKLLTEATSAANVREIVDYHRGDLQKMPIPTQRDIKKLRDNKISKLKGEKS